MRLAVALAVVGAFVLGLEEAPAARQQRNSGVSNTCGEFEVLVINGGIFGSLAITGPGDGIGTDGCGASQDVRAGSTDADEPAKQQNTLHHFSREHLKRQGVRQ